MENLFKDLNYIENYKHDEYKNANSNTQSKISG